MNHLRAVRIFVVMLVCILSAPGVWAQLVETRVENAEVVYVEGNDVILKSTNGEVRQFEIPDNSTFTIDGNAVTVHELKPGMKLTARITTANAPRLVDAVNIIDLGTVWKISGNNLIVRNPDGENKIYRVPSGGKITLEGKEIALNQLHEGDKITATVVKTRAPLEVGKATSPALQAPATPAKVGVLLIDEDGNPVETPGMWTTPVIIGLIILALVVMGLIFLASRRKRKALPKERTVA
ncbi:MAG TPA: hypothetical protein VLT13_13820 [Bacteroidota bacterium]|nr:hypothetical protein [Bacteroidota bacterium]